MKNRIFCATLLIISSICQGQEVIDYGLNISKDTASFFFIRQSHETVQDTVFTRASAIRFTNPIFVSSYASDIQKEVFTLRQRIVKILEDCDKNISQLDNICSAADIIAIPQTSPKPEKQQTSESELERLRRENAELKKKSGSN